MTNLVIPDDAALDALVASLESWGPLVSGGYEVPAAGSVMFNAAAAITALRAQNAAIRAEALEEAARVALRPFLPVDIGGDFICNPTQGECTAAAIRALIAQPAEGGEDRA